MRSTSLRIEIKPREYEDFVERNKINLYCDRTARHNFSSTRKKEEVPQFYKCDFIWHAEMRVRTTVSGQHIHYTLSE